MSEFIESTAPAHGYAVIGQVEVSTPAEVSYKVEQANAAKTPWKELGVEGRIKLLEPIRDEFIAQADDIAKIISLETGKPINNSYGEVLSYAEDITWLFENAPKALADEVTHEDNNSLHRVAYEPKGVAAVITPWNFPFGMAVWGTFPNLVAGNPVVLKTSEENPMVGKAFESIMLSHDLPEGVFGEVYGDGKVGKDLSEQAGIDLLWFTGSSATGKTLYKTAAEQFIPATLEMGGSNPTLVFEDADAIKAAQRIFNERFQNNGQVCTATKRAFIHEQIAKPVTAELKRLVEDRVIGDPFAEGTETGSLVSAKQAAIAQGQLDDALSKGAKIWAKKDVPEDLSGAYFPQVVLAGVTRDMKVWHEETFAPILPVSTFKTEEEAVRLANDTVYGLGARVISADLERAERVASRIDAGTVEINEGSRWLPQNPFGGNKSSGMGREHGVHGLRELTQPKTISRSKS
ncbi:MAG: aldehyde dehydrogenase family protein [Patescibacteria group bacterium]